MTTPQGPRKRLPNNPSEENLRKQAKQLAKDEGLQLAAAQRRLAIEYGYHNWAELMRAVAAPLVPVLPLRELVAFPRDVYPIYIARPRSINAIDAAISLSANAPILLVAQRDSSVAAPSAPDMYKVGTLAVIVQRLGLPDGTVKVLAEGKKRAKVTRFVVGQKFLSAEVEAVAETTGSPSRLEALMRSVCSAFHSYADGRTTILRETADWIEKLDDPSVVSDRIACHMNLRVGEQQALLECVSPVERLEKILGYLEAAN
jgi:ATP-dependent Lon protease